MDYQFHVGDYVETKDGDIGVITEVNTDDSSLWYGSACWYCTSSRGLRTEKCTYVIPDGTDVDMARIYNRIGQYNFTKKNEGKIEPLVKSWVLGNVDSRGEYYFDHREIIKKIKELIEVVNQLGEEIQIIRSNLSHKRGENYGNIF